jgi:hypothetical protein
MYLSARSSRTTRIGGGPLFWLFGGPFILVGYALMGAFILASIIGAAVVAGVLALIAKASTETSDHMTGEDIDHDRDR